MKEFHLFIASLVLYTFCIFQLLYFYLKKKEFKKEIAISLLLMPLVYLWDRFWITSMIKISPEFVKNLEVIIELNIIVQFIIVFLVFDFVVYLMHRLYHKSNFFWCNHLIHHSGKEYGVHLKFRESFISILPLFFIPIFFLVGFNYNIIILNFLIVFVVDTLNHSDTDIRIPFIEYVIVTPATHRIHHHIRDKRNVKNYGNILLIWDQLFKTYEHPKNGQEKVIIGVKDAHQFTNNPFKLCIDPFISYFARSKNHE